MKLLSTLWDVEKYVVVSWSWNQTLQWFQVSLNPSIFSCSPLTPKTLVSLMLYILFELWKIDYRALAHPGPGSIETLCWGVQWENLPHEGFWSENGWVGIAWAPGHCPVKGSGSDWAFPRSFIKLLGGKCWSLVDLVPHLLTLITCKEGGPPAPSLHRRSYKCWLPLFPVCSRGILEVSRSVSGSELLSSEDTRDILGQAIVVGAVVCTVGCFSSTPGLCLPDVSDTLTRSYDNQERLQVFSNVPR